VEANKEEDVRRKKRMKAGKKIKERGEREREGRGRELRCKERKKERKVIE